MIFILIVSQIWQKDGLDLCLIPYGCVATGPNSGTIEVVKGAKTVANVRILCTSEAFQLHSCIQISGFKNTNKLLQ